MKNIFALLSISTLLFQVLTIEVGLAQTDPQLQESPLEQATRYQDRGRGKSEEGDQEGAIADFNRSIEIFPKDPFTFYLRGLTKFKLKDKQGAISDMTTATELIRQDGSQNKYHQRYLKLIEQFNTSLATDKK
jgi:tetratricopeptide (TPR) repeat protein